MGIRIALIQMDTRWHDLEANLEHARWLLSKAEGADLAVLPEMATSGFSIDLEAAAELVPAESPCGSAGRTSAALSAMAAEFNVNLVAGAAFRVQGERLGRNVALAYDRKGCLMAAYTKIHPFSPAGEHLMYMAGDQPTVFSVDGITATAFICYDLRFPEIFRITARKVKLMLVLANWPEQRIEHWSALLKARAIENQCYVAGVNRVGIDGGGIVYSGASQVYGPTGELLVTGGLGEGPVFADIDPGLVDKARASFPALRDMRRTWD